MSKIQTLDDLEKRRRQLMCDGGIYDIRRRRRYHRLAYVYWNFQSGGASARFARLHKKASISGRVC